MVEYPASEIFRELEDDHMSDKIKVGIIGCGGIANGKHMPSLKQLSDVEMVAFCDIVEEKAINAAKAYGTPDAKVYTDYKKILEDPDIISVHVCTPNKSHSFITIDALNAGKHVLCEKPMAKTAAEAEKMLEAAKKSGKLLTIGYQGRFNPDVQYMKKVADAGELGDMYLAKPHAIRRRAVPTWGVFLNEDEQGGGPLIDIGTHALDMTLWIMNNYKPKYAVGTTYKKLNDQTDTANIFGEWKPEEFTVEDSAFGFVVMENGATIILESSWALNTLDVGEVRTTICGTKAGIDNCEGVRINRVRAGKMTIERPELGAGGVAFFDGTSCSPEVMEQKVFYSAIKNGTPLVTLPEQALVVSQILEAIYVSAKTGKPYYFS